MKSGDERVPSRSLRAICANYKNLYTLAVLQARDNGYSIFGIASESIPIKKYISRGACPFFAILDACLLFLFPSHIVSLSNAWYHFDRNLPYHYERFHVSRC